MSGSIKFRTWDLERGAMRSVAFIEFDAAGELCNVALVAETLNNKHRSSATFENRPNADDLILEQFTGLHDKNGKEIYEGDALLDSTGDMHGYVYFDSAAFRARWKYAKPRTDQRTDFFCSGPLAQERCHEAEIIGNIHENPELLP